MPDKPRQIPGIFNYCDRWCERCPFRSNCTLFESERQFKRELRNGGEAALWGEFMNMLEESERMFQDAADKGGTSQEALDHVKTEFTERTQKERRSRLKGEDSLRLAKKYAKMVNRYFRHNRASFYQKLEEWFTAILLCVPERDPAKEASEMQDAFEVIRWYQDLISIKLSRALSNRDHTYSDEKPGEPTPIDCAGTAKVALIAMDRSIDAWITYRGIFPENGDQIIDLLAQLAKLTRRTEALLPRARAFKRPGFDDDQGKHW